MSCAARAYAPTKTPIELIFQKVMHRRMSSKERIYFHLKRRIKPTPTLNTSRLSKVA
jgi:hypothetical protein